MNNIVNAYHYNSNKDLYIGPIWSPDDPDCAQTFWSSYISKTKYPDSYDDIRGENSIFWKLIQRGKDLPETITNHSPSYRFLNFRRGGEDRVLYYENSKNRRMVYCRGIYGSGQRIILPTLKSLKLGVIEI